jgi:hypothetical protein
MSSSTPLDRPLCPQCGKPIGTYEPVWWFAPRIGAERTSWLNLQAALSPADSLWHVACAEQEGVDGG